MLKRSHFIGAAICLFIGCTSRFAVAEEAIHLTAHTPVQVTALPATVDGLSALRVVKRPEVEKVDEPTFVRLDGVNFKNGIIDLKVRSRLLKEAPAHARGFIGLAFRINETNTQFECIYLRPTNARADDQVRRNHSIQYFAYPDFKFDRLRKESPEAYESYTDMALDEWIQMRIEVKGTQAKLFLNNHPQPSLVVNDLKLGTEASGGIGLWVDIGTEGYFTDLKVTPGS